MYVCMHCMGAMMKKMDAHVFFLHHLFFFFPAFTSFVSRYNYQP